MQETNEKWFLPHLALIGVQVCFGTGPVVGKIVLQQIPAVGLVGFRVGITSIALILFQASRGRFWLKEKGDYWRLAVLSVFGVTLNQLFFVTGLSLTKASNTSLLAITIPIFALTVGAIAGIEKLRLIKVAGILLAALGVILIIDPRNASFSSETTRGDLLIITNSLCYGIYVATSKTVVSRNGAFRSMMWVFIFASVICLPLGVYSMSSVDFGAVAPSVWVLVGYIAIGVTAAPYLLTAWAIARVDPSTVAVYIYLYPLIGLLLAVAFLGEQIGLSFIAAAALIFAGLYLVIRPRRPTSVVLQP
ncbi:MAG TPA: DMT family transporter [Pyrinomonadaceae bacterium]|jgi:drug/metabolite transporter (DMT)-like permease|nr:DMT family transporter [Pyrinomonadaceae bacterium]